MQTVGAIFRKLLGSKNSGLPVQLRGYQESATILVANSIGCAPLLCRVCRHVQHHSSKWKQHFPELLRQDYFFAEMLAIKLSEGGFKIWRDQGSIRARDDWRQSIEDGIKDCLAVIVALSANSANSAYVTYEWAYAIGMSKPVIPVKLSECTIHPKLEPTHYIDFSYPRSLPWSDLLQRLRDVEVERESNGEEIGTAIRGDRPASAVDQVANSVLEYLNSRGFTMASLDRLKERITPTVTDEMLYELIQSRPALFRSVMLKGGRPGIAKRVP